MELPSRIQKKTSSVNDSIEDYLDAYIFVVDCLIETLEIQFECSQSYNNSVA